MDVCRAKTGGFKLRHVGFAKIQMNIFRRWLVAGRPHVEPLNWIGFVAGARLVEVFVAIGELGREFGNEFNADFVTARPDGWADCGEKIRGLAAKFGLHAADGLSARFGQAFRASPRESPQQHASWDRPEESGRNQPFAQRAVSSACWCRSISDGKVRSVPAVNRWTRSE